MTRPINAETGPSAEAVKTTGVLLASSDALAVPLPQVGGAFAPPLKDLCRFLQENPEYGVPPEWADVVKQSVSVLFSLQQFMFRTQIQIQPWVSIHLDIWLY